MCTRTELVNESLVIYLIENQKLSYEQASSILKEKVPGVRSLSSRSFRRFCSKRRISSRVTTEKVPEVLMQASSMVISTIWSWWIWRNSPKYFYYRFFYYYFKILSPLFYGKIRFFIYNSFEYHNCHQVGIFKQG